MSASAWTLVCKREIENATPLPPASTASSLTSLAQRCLRYCAVSRRTSPAGSVHRSRMIDPPIPGAPACRCRSMRVEGDVGATAPLAGAPAPRCAVPVVRRAVHDGIQSLKRLALVLGRRVLERVAKAVGDRGDPRPLFLSHAQGTTAYRWRSSCTRLMEVHIRDVCVRSSDVGGGGNRTRNGVVALPSSLRGASSPSIDWERCVGISFRVDYLRSVPHARPSR